MKLSLRLIVLFFMVWTAGSFAQAQEKTDRAEYTFAHAGISFTASDDFKPQLLEHPKELARLVKFSGDSPQNAVIFGAYLVGLQDNLETVSQFMLQTMSQSLSIRELEMLKNTPISVAGITGQATLMKYKYRGKQTVSAQTYFIRELKNLNLRICYIISVEAPQQDNASLLQLLGEIINTVKLIAVEHPSAEDVKLSQNKIKNLKRGVAIKVPSGWYAVESDMGISLGVIDYLCDEQTLPNVDVVAVDIPGLVTSEVCSKKALAAFVSQSADQGLETRIVCQEPIEIAGKPASSFVMIIKPQPTTQPETSTGEDKPLEGIVRAVASLSIPVPEENITKSYGIIMTARESDCKAAMLWLKTVADGIEIFKTSK